MSKIKVSLKVYCGFCYDCETHCPAYPCHEIENQYRDYDVEVKLVKKESGKDGMD